MQDRIDGILLKSQQAYLIKLGFYRGKIDGFWGPKTKAAMVKYRESSQFYPANVKRGDGPFVPFEKLPKGFDWNILDGQRCMMEKSSLPASFAVQELVNLILKPTVVSSEKTPQMNQSSSVPSIGQTTQTEAVRSETKVDSNSASNAEKTELDQNLDFDPNSVVLSNDNTNGNKGSSSTQFQKSGQNQNHKSDKK